MQTLIDALRRDHPDLCFVAGDMFSWSPTERVIRYCEAPADTQHARWALLHEVGHALLGHADYHNDFELVQLEADAWQRACQLAADYRIHIPQEHIEDCLDTYRDWLHNRSLCPACRRNGLETGSGTYNCLNCRRTWQVTKQKLKRVYRRSQTTAHTKPSSH